MIHLGLDAYVRWNAVLLQHEEHFEESCRSASVKRHTLVTLWRHSNEGTDLPGGRLTVSNI